MSKKQTAFSAKVSTPQTDDDQPVSMDDFCRYLMQPNAYFFIPCREIWPGSSVNARLPRVPVLTKSGQPKRDKNGKPITIPATKWIDENRRVEQTTWHPGLPMFITDRLAVAGGWVEKRGTIASISIARRVSCWATAAKPSRGSTTCARSIRTTPITSFAGWPTTGSIPATRSITRLVLGGAQGIGKDTLLAAGQARRRTRGIFTTSRPTHLFGPVQRLRQIGHSAGQ